jgi:membrane protease YdiL (CAAX protease family)
MEPVAIDDVPRAPAAQSAGRVLRPAFVLWLVIVGAWGACWLLTAVAIEANGFAEWMLWLHTVVQVAVAVCIVRYARRDREAARIFGWPRGGTFELCLLVGIGGAMLLAVWERTIPSWGPGSFEWEREAGWQIAPVLIAGAVLPAVFEELAFRGVILARLVVVFGPWFALVLQAAMFSVMHADGVYLLPHFAFGCLTGFLRLAAGALWPCMLLHFVWNGWIALEVYELI